MISRLFGIAGVAVLLSLPVTARGQDAATEASLPTLTLDGQLRVRTEFLDTPDFGFEGTDSTNLLLLRALLGTTATFHPLVHARIELGTAQNLSTDPVLRPFDVDHFYLQQAYAQVSLPLFKKVETSLRIGRQEIPLGSSRLVGVREGPNVRLSFDGFRTDVAFPHVQIKGFGLAEVVTREGPFDDLPKPFRALWGIYGTVLPDLDGEAQPSFDLYYLGIKRSSSYRETTGDELRHSFGTRIFGNVSHLRFNWEAVVQLGRFSSQRILAYTIAAEQGFVLRLRGLEGQLGLRANLTSGDSDAADEKLQTFNPLYPKLPYFSELALLAPMNHRDIHPFLQIEVGDSWSMEASYLWYFKHRNEDDIYAPSGRPVGSSQPTMASEIGQQVNLEGGYHPGDHLQMVLSYSKFFVGPALRELAGVDSSLFLFWTKLTF